MTPGNGRGLVVSRRKEPRFVVLVAAVRSPQAFVKVAESVALPPDVARGLFDDVEVSRVGEGVRVGLLLELESDDRSVLDSRPVDVGTAARVLGPDHDVPELVAAALRSVGVDPFDVPGSHGVDDGDGYGYGDGGEGDVSSLEPCGGDFVLEGAGAARHTGDAHLVTGVVHEWEGSRL